MTIFRAFGLSSLLVLSSLSCRSVSQKTQLQEVKARQALQLPSEFTIEQKLLSLVFTFDIKKGQSKIGAIKEKVFRLTRSFNLFDSAHRKIGEARQKFFSWGAQIDVFDQQGKKIGSFKEQITKSFFKWSTTYSILDAQGKVIGTSKKADYITTSLSIKDRSGREIMTMERPFFRIREYWNVSLNQNSKIDNRILVSIAAFKSKVDYERRKKK